MRRAGEENVFGAVGLSVMREADFIFYTYKNNKKCPGTFVHSSPKLEITQMAINRKIDK